MTAENVFATSSGMNVIQGRDIRDGKLTLKCDAVIVGSGSGGAMMAWQLAKAGRKVVILEAGPYVPSSEFTERFGDTLSHMYQDSGAQTTSLGDVIIMQGRCVGGSSVFSAAIMNRPPEFVLARWRDEHGLNNITPKDLDPYFERIEKDLSVHVNTEKEINQNSRLIRQGAEVMGYSVKPVARATKNCALTGHCLSGCASDRKQSALVTYLPWALAKGAQLYSDTTVTKVLTKSGVATGVLAEIFDHETGQKACDLKVEAAVVVLAAGAIQSPVILQRSNICNSSGLLGKNLSMHPSVVIIAKFPEPVMSWQGATVGVYVDEFITMDKGGLMFNPGMPSPEAFVGVCERKAGDDGITFMKDYKYYASMPVFAVDDNPGEVQWTGQGSGHKISWSFTPEVFANLKRSLKIGAQLFFAAGAEKVIVPSFEVLDFDSVENIDKVVEKIDYGVAKGLFSFRVVSYQPQGSCRMGRDASKAVVNPFGETHDVQRLFVCDASILPTVTHVHTEMTVYAMSAYIADNINKLAWKYFA